MLRLKKHAWACERKELFCIIMMASITSVSLLFIHSRYFFSASSSPLLLSGAPHTARVLCWSFTPKHHRQLRVKDLPKVPTWRPERDSNQRAFGQKATNLAMSHHAPHQFLMLHVPILRVHKNLSVFFKVCLNFQIFVFLQALTIVLWFSYSGFHLPV